MNTDQLFSNNEFHGFEIQTHRGKLNEVHLSKMLDILQTCQREYLETFCIRTDLHLPDGYIPLDNHVIERFIASLRAKLNHSESMREKKGIRVHTNKVRFIWCREISQTGRHHYHVLLMLNKQAYAHLGLFDRNCNNLYNRICDAWSSAIALSTSATAGLVHFPDNSTMFLRRDCQKSLSDVFFRVSYFAKHDTKPVGQNFHTLGTSRG